MKNFILILIVGLFLTGCTSSQTVSNDKQAEEDRVNNKVEKIVEENSEKVVVDQTNKNREEAVEGVAKGITVKTIKAGDTLVSPALIQGTADVENVVIELRNDKHEAVVSVPAKVYSGEFGIKEYWFKFSNTKTGYLAVYEDGNMENITELPVNFKTEE